MRVEGRQVRQEIQRWSVGLVATVGVVSLAACGASAGPTATSSPTASQAHEQCTYQRGGQAARTVTLPKTTDVAETGSVVFVLTTNAGPITITMNRSKAPCTINSFASLASQKYFDKTHCHRLVTSGIFVLQCGDPTATGTGGPGYTFPDELTGSETYPSGTVAMANSGANTNGSQFFLVYRDSQLPASYTVFGQLDAASLAVVDKIAADGEDDSFGSGDGKPKNPAEILTVTQR